MLSEGFDVFGVHTDRYNCVRTGGLKLSDMHSEGFDVFGVHMDRYNHVQMSGLKVSEILRRDRSVSECLA